MSAPHRPPALFDSRAGLHAAIFNSIQGESRGEMTMAEKKSGPQSGADILVQCLINHGVDVVFA